MKNFVCGAHTIYFFCKYVVVSHRRKSGWGGNPPPGGKIQPPSLRKGNPTPSLGFLTLSTCDSHSTYLGKIMNQQAWVIHCFLARRRTLNTICLLSIKIIGHKIRGCFFLFFITNRFSGDFSSTSIKMKKRVSYLSYLKSSWVYGLARATLKWFVYHKLFM